jgi:spore germination protein YaaH
MTQIANKHHIKLLPLVGNVDFDRAKVHALLSDSLAQNRAIDSILKLCQENHYAGIQIDFEGMSFLDRDAFTQFYKI